MIIGLKILNCESNEFTTFFLLSFLPMENGVLIESRNKRLIFVEIKNDLRSSIFTLNPLEMKDLASWKTNLWWWFFFITEAKPIISSEIRETTGIRKLLQTKAIFSVIKFHRNVSQILFKHSWLAKQSSTSEIRLDRSAKFSK